MDGKQMLLALDYVDDSLIAEAAKEKPLKRRARPAKWIALAASLTFVIAAAVAVPNLLRPEIQPENTPGVVTPDESVQENIHLPTDEEDPEDGASAQFRIDRDDIHLNSTSGIAAAMSYYPPELYDEIQWDSGDVISYFGRGLTPAYLPEGLTENAGDGTETVYRQKSDGALVYDAVAESYGRTDVEYTDSGAVILPEGFTLTASRLGILNDCIYVLPGEDEIRTTDIAGTAVTIGYREMEYGPYDPETHAPSGTYPLYVFQFTLDGVNYDITTHNLPLDEAVKITASFITGSAAVEIVD